MSNVVEMRRDRSAPPCVSLETEQAFLGALLLSNAAFPPVAGFLQPDHFSHPLHQRIYQLAAEAISGGKLVDPFTLKPFLGDADLPDGTTLPAYLARLCAEATTVLNAPHYARSIRDLALRRDLIKAAADLTAQASDMPIDMEPAEIAAGALASLQTIAEAAAPAERRLVPGETALALIERAKAIQAGEQHSGAVPTGLPELDRYTGGFAPGTLWIIGGRPRHGKSICATGFARKVADRGRRALNLGEGEPVGSMIFSLELPEDQIVARILADLAYLNRKPITYGQILAGDLDEERLWMIEDAQKRLADLPLTIDASPGLTLPEIESRIRAEQSRMLKRGVRLAVVFLDYLKFIKASDRYRGNRVYEIGEISGGLKQAAKRLGVCIVLLAQVGRGVEAKDRKDQRPTLADLRDSGDLEADADVVVFIHRESIRLKHAPEFKANDPGAVLAFENAKHEGDLIVAKTRLGEEGGFKFWIEPGCSTFAAVAR